MEVTDRNFREEVLEADLPVLVDFWASWCIPCKVTEVILDHLEEEFRGRVRVCKLNVDRNPMSAGQYGICGVPTFITLRDGQVIERKVAAQDERSLRGMMERVIAPKEGA